ncbi:MAG: S8 family serine peptidase [Hyphomicrobiales bacterium]
MKKNYFFINSLLKLSTLLLVVTIAFTSCKKDKVAEVQNEIETVSVDPNAIPGQYIVVLDSKRMGTVKRTSNYEERTELFKNQILSIIGTQKMSSDMEILNVYSSAITGFAAKLSKEDVARLKNLPEVISVESDRKMQLDQRELSPISTELPRVRADYFPWGINYIGGAYQGEGKVAWVIDSGIDLDHPDLNVDQTKGRCYCVYYSSNPGPNDDNGHGSHVAGTIAAKYNSIGVVGVAANATVIPVKVVNSTGHGTESDCVKAVDYVSYNGKAGEVANMSLGYSPNTILDNAVKNAAAKGIKFAIAAGNEHSNAQYVTPARVVATNVYKAAAINSSGSWASFSNYGNVVDWALPGVGVWSTYKNGEYSKLDGTSMASPHLAGMLLITSNIKTKGHVTCPYDNKSYKIAKF